MFYAQEIHASLTTTDIRLRRKWKRVNPKVRKKETGGEEGRNKVYIKIDNLCPRIQAMIIQSRSALCAQLRDIDSDFNSISPVGLRMDVSMDTRKKSKTKEKMH